MCKFCKYMDSIISKNIVIVYFKVNDLQFY